MKTVIISPFSRPLRNGKMNAKNYPYWENVIGNLDNMDIRTIQVGQKGEREICGVSEVRQDISLSSLEELIKQSNTWISVDNFFHHLCAYLKKPGVVIFGKSDPRIFGHSINTNLLRVRSRLRPLQFRWWDEEPYDIKAFVDAQAVCDAVTNILNK